MQYVESKQYSENYMNYVIKALCNNCNNVFVSSAAALCIADFAENTLEVCGKRYV